MNRTDRIKKLRNLGYSYGKIGSLLGITRQRVWSIINPSTCDKPKEIRELHKLLLKNASCAWGETCINEKSVIPEYREKMLIVHHKDLDHNNDAPENLFILCKSCHALFHILERQSFRT